MSGYRVGVLGATGAVGSTILRVLEQRAFPVGELVPFASARSVGKPIELAGRNYRCVELGDDTIDGLDIVISAAGGSISAEWAPRLVAGGAVVIDNTSYWRMHEGVPLVVAEVNPADAARHRGLIANPNCSTMQMVVALKPILDAVGIERLVISTYQSVSGTGRRAIEELRAQSIALLEGGAEPTADVEVEANVYPHRIAFNVLPQVESFAAGDDYTTEERKMMAETRKIFGLDADQLGISATCARVPVFGAHSESVNVQTTTPLSPEECRALLASAPGVVVVDDPAASGYPLAFEATGRDEVLVGRIRRDPSHERCLNLWIVADNLRKGAATNAVQIAELLVARGLVSVPTPSLVA